MKDEIKEILAYFEEYVKIIDMHDSEPMLNWQDLKIVLDYINNLEEEIKYLQKENNELKEDLEVWKNLIEKKWSCN